MRVTQNTSGIDAAIVNEIIAFVCPPGVTGNVRITKTNADYCGRAYPKGGYGHSRPFAIVRIGPAKLFPRRGADKRKLRQRWREYRKQKPVPMTTTYYNGGTVTHKTRMVRPTNPNGGKGYLPRPAIASQTEALVYIMAHELRHLWQGRVPRGRRVWGARGQYSERDADAYALRMLRAWRRRGIVDGQTDI